MAFIARLTSEPDPHEIGKRLILFGNGTYRQCPICTGEITGSHAYYGIYDPECCTIYIRPCDCRLGRFVGVPQWLKDANLVIEYHHDDDSVNEPDVYDLLDMGIVPSDPTPEYWQAYNQRQEAAGQLRLPLQDEPDSTRP
jgi:hypothetical protein